VLAAVERKPRQLKDAACRHAFVKEF